MRTTTKLGLSAAAAVTGTVLWWRRNPSACPYNQRFWVRAPHPFITRARLREALDPEPGETILEIGPGTGYYTLDVASALEPGGTMHIFDIQQAMLDHTMRRAGEQGLTNIVPRLGDARELPYEDETFDAAVMITVLGEIPDQERALAEVSRVLKEGGRLVVGELFGDPHMVSERSLRDRSERAGLRFEGRVGPRLGYFGILHPESER